MQQNEKNIPLFQFQMMYLNYFLNKIVQRIKHLFSKKTLCKYNNNNNGEGLAVLLFLCTPTVFGVSRYQLDCEMLWVTSSSWKLFRPSWIKSLIRCGSFNSSICSSWVRWPRMVARHRSCSEWNSRFNRPRDISKKKTIYIYYWLQEIDKKSKKVKTKLQQFKFIFIHCNWEPLFPHLFCMLCCRQWGRGALWHLATRWMPRPDTSHPYSRSACLPLRRSRDRS